MPTAHQPGRIDRLYRRGSALTGTGAGLKKMRKTWPKMNSSTTKPTATEKINPATTAMNVIASCIPPSLDMGVLGNRQAGAMLLKKGALAAP